MIELLQLLYEASASTTAIAKKESSKASVDLGVSLALLIGPGIIVK